VKAYGRTAAIKDFFENLICDIGAAHRSSSLPNSIARGRGTRHADRAIPQPQ
jgi:hypothetical protein